jgi:hypothetical protein
MGDEFDRNRRYVNSMTQDEIEKEMKPPEKVEPKKPGKIPLSANRSAITEEPATTSSTSQNYKQTPDMNKGEDDVDKSTRARERTKPITQWGRPHTAKLRTANIEPYGELKKDMEPITKSDEAALKKCITDATTIFKGMTLMLDKGTLKENRSGHGNMREKGSPYRAGVKYFEKPPHPPTISRHFNETVKYTDRQSTPGEHGKHERSGESIKPEGRSKIGNP